MTPNELIAEELDFVEGRSPQEVEAALARIARFLRLLELQAEKGNGWTDGDWVDDT